MSVERLAVIYEHLLLGQGFRAWIPTSGHPLVVLQCLLIASMLTQTSVLVHNLVLFFGRIDISRLLLTIHQSERDRTFSCQKQVLSLFK